MKKEIKFIPTRDGVLVNWKASDSKLMLSPELKKEIEMAENGIVEVVEIGPDVKNIKPGQFVLLNAAGRLINLNNKTYGLIKSFQIDGIYSEKPDFVKLEVSESALNINTSKTEQKISQLNKKFDIN